MKKFLNDQYNTINHNDHRQAKHFETLNTTTTNNNYKKTNISNNSTPGYLKYKTMLKEILDNKKKY